MQAGKLLRILSIVFLLTGIHAIVYAQQQTISLNQLIEEALKNNPDYLSARDQALSAKSHIPQAGALPDPNLSFAIMNLPINSFDFNQEPMTGKKISLMQMFPFPGKLGIKKDIAAHRARVAEFQVEEMKNNLIKNIKVTYYNIFFVNKAIEVVEKNKSLIKQFIRVIETKYSVGKSLQQDVLKAQVELSKLNDKLISLQQKRRTLILTLNKLVNRNFNTAIEELPDIEKSVLNADAENLEAWGLKQRPLLKSWYYMVEKANSARRLAKKGYLPDFSLGVAYTQRDDLLTGMKMYDFFSAELKINLPIYFYRKQAKKVEQTQLLFSSVEEKYAAVKNEVIFQIHNTLINLKKSAQLIDLYKTGIIPQASQSLNSAISGYQVDKVDFLTLLNNQMTLFNYEVEYYRVLADHEKYYAELEAAVGINLNTLRDTNR